MDQEVTRIFGAPGCGKTTRLMSILREELKRGVPPDRIAYVSFTRKGTYEGVERARTEFGYRETDLPYFRTLHSIAFREGGYTKHDVIDRDEYKSFSEIMGMNFVGYYTEEFYNNDDKYLFVHFLRRENPAAAERYIADPSFDVDSQRLADVEHNYPRFKLHERVIDFTDMIEAFILRNEPLPIDVAIIDEAQDLTSLQWKMCDVAFRGALRLYIAGDDDQAIYEWSGADIKHFLHMQAGHTEILDKSWRLHAKVLRLAKSISAKISDRVEKNFAPLDDVGKIYYHNSLDSLVVDPSQSWYFLSRNNYFLQRYTTFLKDRSFVYWHRGKLSVDPMHVKLINTFETARKRGSFEDVERLAIEHYARGTIDLSRPWYENLALENDVQVYYRDLIKMKVNTTKSNLTVSTIHGVKGGEADNVVVLMDYTKSVRANMERNLDAELRCLYVAVTRTKRNLHIVFANSQNGYDNYITFK